MSNPSHFPDSQEGETPTEETEELPPLFAQSDEEESPIQSVKHCRKVSARPSAISIRVAVLWLLSWVGLSFWVASLSTGESLKLPVRTVIINAATARHFVKLQRQIMPSWFQWWFDLDASRSDLLSLVQEAEEKDAIEQGAKLEWAILCHEFASETDNDAWIARGKQSLTKMPAGTSGIYFIAAKKALEGAALTKDEVLQLRDFCAKYYDNWFVAHLAISHQQDHFVNQAALRNAARIAFNKEFAILLVFHGAFVLLVIGGYKLWSRRMSVATILKTGYARYLHLWSWTRVFRAVSIWGCVQLVASIAVSRWGYDWLRFLGADAHNIISMTYALCYIAAALLTVMVPVFLAYAFARDMGGLHRVLGIEGRDFRSKPSWLIGGLAGLCFVGAMFLIELMLSSIGLSGRLDSLSRSMSELGQARWTVILLWSCLLAPYCEEIVFRGFLFVSLRNSFGIWLGASASSAVFAIVHHYSLTGITIVFVFGMAQCWLFNRTGRLAHTMIAHATVNFIYTILLVLELS